MTRDKRMGGDAENYACHARLSERQTTVSPNWPKPEL
jgi:hypothetical protein